MAPPGFDPPAADGSGPGPADGRDDAADGSGPGPADGRDDAAEGRDDDARLVAYAAALADAVEAELGGWVRRAVAARATAAGVAVDEAAVRAAAEQAVAQVAPAVRALLATDVDRQATTPLHLLRGAVRYPTAVLAGAGVPPVPRDPEAVALFPDDAYDLTPGSFADVSPALHEPGIRWGAAKAFVHRARHR